MSPPGSGCGVTWESLHAALIVTGADLVLAVAAGLLAARSSPGRIELEALAVRRRALERARTIALALARVAAQCCCRRRTCAGRSRG